MTFFSLSQNDAMTSEFSCLHKKRNYELLFLGLKYE